MFLIWSSTLPCHAEDDTTETVRLNLEVLAQRCSNNNSYQLLLTLTNPHETSIRLYRHALPWVQGPDRFQMEAITLDPSFSRLDPVYRLENPVGVITLKPGQSIQSTLPLHRKFHGLSQQLEMTSVALLWSYMPVSPDKKLSFDMRSGVLMLTKENIPLVTCSAEEHRIEAIFHSDSFSEKSIKHHKFKKGSITHENYLFFSFILSEKIKNTIGIKSTPNPKKPAKKEIKTLSVFLKTYPKEKNPVEKARMKNNASNKFIPLLYFINFILILR